MSTKSDIQNTWQIKCQQTDIGKTNVCKFFKRLKAICYFFLEVYISVISKCKQATFPDRV